MSNEAQAAAQQQLDAPDAAAAAAQQLAGDVANIQLASGSSKPTTYVYTSSSTLSKEHYLIAWELAMLDDKIPEENWARRAMRFFSPDILALFMGTEYQPKDVATMAWADFKTRFLEINAGPLITTTYGNLNALHNLYYRPHKPFDLATTLREAESIINRLNFTLPDPVKIMFITKTLPPYLKEKVMFAPGGKDHADYNAFRTSLLAQDSTTPRPPAANGNNGNHRRPSNGHSQRRPHNNRYHPGNNGNNSNNHGPRNTPMKRSGHGYKRPNSEVTCYKCGQKGHIAPNCTNSKTN